MKVVHVCVDEKFIDCAINAFNKLEGVDSYYFVYTQNQTLKYIKNKDVLIFNSETELVDAVNKAKCAYVIIHSLCLNYAHILQIKPKIIWNSWGFDIYSDCFDSIKKAIPLSLYKPISRNVLKSLEKKSFEEKIFFLLKRIKKKIVDERLYKAVVHKAAYLSTIIPPEYDLIHKQYKHIKFCPFRYLDDLKEEDFYTPPKENENVDAKKILLGNSNDPSNNHLDILHKLNSLNKKYEVIIPFSYPNKATKYIEYVLNNSSKFDNLKITFLRDFMSMDRYFEILKSCQSAIFGHIRQQAVGNVSGMINLGKKVFLYEDSTLYSYYKKEGYKIFSIDHDLEANNIEVPLNINDKKANHQKNMASRNYSNFIKKLQSFFDNLPND